MFGALFYLLFVLLVSDRRCLDISLFEKVQDYEKTLSSSKRGARQVTVDHFVPISFLSLVYTCHVH
jgi:hypothetical protein